jgi:hypothetical protein
LLEIFLTVFVVFLDGKVVKSDRVGKMLITSNSSPVSGELLEDGALGGELNELPAHLVPESSHTIEIQYISHVPELHIYDTEGTTTVLEENLDEQYKNCVFVDNEVYDYTVYSDEIETRAATEHINKQNGFDNPSSSNDCSTDSCCYDANSGETDLTNLNWLQNITNIMAMPTLPLAPVSPKPPPKPIVKNVRLNKLKQTIMRCQEDFMEHVEEYQSNTEKKPPYSYCTLICLAMRYNANKMTLSAIYNWIRENFKYYRNADPSWQVRKEFYYFLSFL